MHDTDPTAVEEDILYIRARLSKPGFRDYMRARMLLFVKHGELEPEHPNYQTARHYARYIAEYGFE